MTYIISLIEDTYFGLKTTEVFTVPTIEEALLNVRTYLKLGYVVQVGTRTSE